MTDQIKIQRDYYARTAQHYDHAHTEPEHLVALHLLAAFIDLVGVKSVLDVGAGTGRAMRFLRERCPGVTVKGIEPVAALREQGYRNGIPEADLVDGDGSRLPFADGAFDLVCEFAVLHHVPKPAVVVDEMNRVAKRGVAISDANFMGQGSLPLRMIKTALFQFGLWPIANWLKTKGKGYTISDGDGLAYSYSVYQNLNQVKACWRRVNVISVSALHDGALGIRMTAPHVFVIGLDK
jgi:ubiquinone/menaquinone biosynthesis C-methylase UbiE